MRYATFGVPELNQQEIKGLMGSDIFSFIRKTGRFNNERGLTDEEGGGR